MRMTSASSHPRPVRSRLRLFLRHLTYSTLMNTPTVIQGRLRLGPTSGGRAAERIGRRETAGTPAPRRRGDPMTYFTHGPGHSQPSPPGRVAGSGPDRARCPAPVAENDPLRLLQLSDELVPEDL